MSDIFQEVDEEVRRERLTKLWERYGNYLVALCVLVVVGVGAWRGYQWWQEKQAVISGAAYEQAAQLAEAGKSKEAEAAFAKLATDGTKGYRVLAGLREAAQLARTDSKAAVAAYDRIAADGSAGPVMQRPGRGPRRLSPGGQRALCRHPRAARAADGRGPRLPSQRARNPGALGLRSPAIWPRRSNGPI